MSDLEEVIDQLWLHATFDEDPWNVDRAYAAIRDDGEVAIEGLIWALRHKDIDLKMLALRLLREFGQEAKRALPAVENCLSDDCRLVRITARETVRLVEGSQERSPLVGKTKCRIRRVGGKLPPLS